MCPLVRLYSKVWAWPVPGSDSSLDLIRSFKPKGAPFTFTPVAKGGEGSSEGDWEGLDIAW